MLHLKLIPMPSMRRALGLVWTASEETSLRASRKTIEGSIRNRQSRPIGPSVEAKRDEPKWQGQWRTLKYL